MSVITSRNIWEDILTVGATEQTFENLMEQSQASPSTKELKQLDEVHITNIGDQEIIWTDSDKRSVQTSLEGHLLFPNGTLLLKGRLNVFHLKMIAIADTKIVFSIRGY